jgi:CRP-like cAMP-binding protein
MRPTLVTAADIHDFTRSAQRPPDRRAEILALEDAEIVYLDYKLVREEDAIPGRHVEVTGKDDLILLTRAELFEGRFANLLHAAPNGRHALTDEAAQTVAETINVELGLAVAAAIYDTHAMGEAAEKDAIQAQTSALRRAEGVARVVELCNGNQSEAARRLGLDQSTVNKLVRKARTATTT